MVEARARELFVNLAVRDLKKAMDFFTTLGFTFDPGFTNDQAACMVVADGTFVMLLTIPFFRKFTTRGLCDTATHTEVLLAITCASPAEVDEMVGKATAAGGTVVMAPQDNGFMYTASFHDLDGHHWEAVWMDLTAVS